MKVVASLIAAFLMGQAAALSVEKKLALLEKAIPLGKKNSGRKLEQNGGMYISSYQSIQFNTCVSLSTELSDEMKETISYSSDLLQLWEDGDLATEKSVVLFSICNTEYCSYESEEDLYVVDLATYMGLAGYRPAKTMAYCEACEQATNWCLYEQYGYNENGEYQGDNNNGQQQNQDQNYNYNQNNGGRFLENVQYVDCDNCESMGCFQQDDQNNNGNNQNGNNENEITLEGMVEWVQGMSECQDTEVQWNGINLYSQFMCNDDGTGIEVGIFIDQECAVYSDQHSYQDIFPNSGYLFNSYSIVTYPFTKDIDCSEDVEWASPEEMYNNDGNNNQNNNQDNGEDQVNEYCQQLVQEEVLPISNCYYNGDQDEEQNQNQDQNQGDYDYYFSSQVYDLSDEQADSAFSICKVVSSLQTEGGGTIDAKQKNVYKSSGSGQIYDYSGGKSSKSSGSGGKVAGIVLGLLAVAAAAFVAFKVYKKKDDERKEPLVTDATLA